MRLVLAMLVTFILLPGPNAFASEKIFFSSNRAVAPSGANLHIWMINPDGTGLEQVTSGNVLDASPQLSPDGRKLVFTRFYSINPDCASIWVRELATGVETQITFGDNAFNPAWSPDGTKIAFSHNTCPGSASQSDVWVLGYPGGGLAALPAPLGPPRSDPTWSPDGTNIVYVRGAAAPVQLFKFTLPSGPDQDLIPGTADERAPNYSPDGTKLAWHTDPGTIFIAGVSNLTSQLTVSGFRFPAWSPNGQKLVVVTGSGNDLWTVNADGTGLTQLTSGPIHDLEPWWGDAKFEVTVAIDIKPGSFPNSINLRSQGRIPVAILSTSTFGAPAEVDLTSLTFGRTGNEASLAFCNPFGEDVNADTLVDLVCHFQAASTAFQLGDTSGILKGRTVTGTPLRGTDSVRIVR